MCAVKKTVKHCGLGLVVFISFKSHKNTVGFFKIILLFVGNVKKIDPL